MNWTRHSTNGGSLEFTPTVYPSIYLSKNFKLQKIRSLQKKAIRAVNNSTFKAHSNPLFSKLKVLNLDDTNKLKCSDIYAWIL